MIRGSAIGSLKTLSSQQKNGHAMIKRLVKKALESKGFTIVRHPIPRFFGDLDFDVVLDVGANRGQYGMGLRRDAGFAKKIVSFEPMSDAFSQLSEQMKPDPQWEGKNWAMGRTRGIQEINVAGNSASSSLLDMLPSHSDVVSGSQYVGKEEIEVRVLDEEFSNFVLEGQQVLLKIDTQGYELEVLLGAAESLNKIAALQLEISLSPLYDGAPLLEDIVSHVRAAGFVPFWFLPGFWNPASHQQLQVDGLFVRKELVSNQ